MEKILKVENVQKFYGNKGNIVKAIDNISFNVNKGEFLGIMGQSGSGKTTLLNLISTIDHVSAGHIFINGEDITELNKKKIAKFRRDHLGFIFQDFNLLDTLTVHENIALALTINKHPIEDIENIVSTVANQLGIKEILNRYPYEISGGQRQRTACARAIATKPSLILADEPTGALDSKSAQMLLETISDLNESNNATILMVTHDPFSSSYCNRIIFIKDGKIFTELMKGEKSRKEFFNEIVDVLTLIGGYIPNVH